MSSPLTAAGQAAVRSPGRFMWIANGFKPPRLPPSSRRAFSFQMAFTLLYAVFEGITANAPLMAVKAMNATDVGLQLPLAMASAGLFGSVFFGAAMARRSKKPFVVVPGFVGAAAALAMAWMPGAGGFLFMTGVISICDFAIRPAIPSIMRSVYPDHCRSRVSGTMRQYGSIVFLGATLASAALLSLAGNAGVHRMIRIEITLAGLASAAAFLCFRQLPELGDGSADEAFAVDDPHVAFERATLAPFRDRRFCKYLAIFFLFAFGNLFHQGVIPAFFARDLGMGYVQATLLIQVIPNLTAFLSGGYLTSWFERTSVWRSYSLVTLMWGLDPLILATLSFSWPALVVARILRGPATLGSMVIAFFTGVHSFARPGGDTSRYMAAQSLMNGVARLLAPATAAFALTFLPRRSIIFYGSLAILLSSLMFWWQDRKGSADAPWRTEEQASDKAMLPYTGDDQTA
jgi:MFS family permease